MNRTESSPERQARAEQRRRTWRGGSRNSRTWKRSTTRSGSPCLQSDASLPSGNSRGSRMDPKLPPDFVDLLTEFAASEVRYLVIGGYAVGFHDRPRATKDLDLLVGGDAERSPGVRSAG